MKFSEKHKSIIHPATEAHDEGHNHDDFENWLLVEIVEQKNSKKLVFTLEKNPFLHKELFLLNEEFEADAEFFVIGQHYHLLRTQQRQEKRSGGDRDRRGGGSRDRGFGGGRDRRGGGSRDRGFGGRDRDRGERRERPEGEGSSEGGERRERSSFDRGGDRNRGGRDRDRRGGGSRDRRGGGSRDRGSSRGRDGGDRRSSGSFEKSWIERK